MILCCKVIVSPMKHNLRRQSSFRRALRNSINFLLELCFLLKPILRCCFLIAFVARRHLSHVIRTQPQILVATTNMPPKSTRKKAKPSRRTSTAMSTGEASPKREPTPSNTPPISSIPQKRALEETDHAPTISSPLNPDFKAKQEDGFVRERVSRTKKDTLKKRESKGGSLAPESNGRATPDLKGLSKVKKEETILSPIRYKILPPRIADFDPPRGPIFVPSHTIIGPDGAEIQFNETTDQ